VEISASLMCADLAHLGSQLQALEHAGVRRLHLDFSDGRFVPDRLLDRDIFRRLPSRERFVRESHLMIAAPHRCLAPFCLESDVVIVHWESTSDVRECLRRIHGEGVRAGLAISPGTAATVVCDLLPEIDLVLVMTVRPGFAGGRFLPEVVPKVAAIRRAVDGTGRAIELEVDGAVNPITIPALAAAGADVFVGGSSGLFTGGDIACEADRMRASAAPPP
jgi:ribulose-phosphate 3-epimerase